MTTATQRKVENLIKITRSNRARVEKVRDSKTAKRSPFVGSAAKYYPALKRLAAK